MFRRKPTLEEGRTAAKEYVDSALQNIADLVNDLPNYRIPRNNALPSSAKVAYDYRFKELAKVMILAGAAIGSKTSKSVLNPDSLDSIRTYVEKTASIEARCLELAHDFDTGEHIPAIFELLAGLKAVSTVLDEKGKQQEIELLVNPATLSYASLALSLVNEARERLQPYRR